MATINNYLYGNLLIFLVSITMTTHAVGSDKSNFEDYRWKHRLILVFAPSTEEPGYQALRKELAVQAEEILDRDILVFHILESAETQTGDVSERILSDDSLREKFSIVSGALTVLLIGKDGGVKLRREGRVKLEEFFSLIDTMPMRQREMREKQQQR